LIIIIIICPPPPQTPQTPPREQRELVPAWKAGTMTMGMVVAVCTTNTAEGDDHQMHTSIS
jgi:hypothetical protein